MNTEAIVALLNEAQTILAEDLPDMDIIEFNATPIGRAISKIGKALDLITEDTPD